MLQTGQEVTPFVDGWNLLQTLGEGAYGEVKLLHNVRSNEFCALKIVHIDWKEAENNVKKEVMILKMLKHENIIKCITHRVEKPLFFIFLEYMDNGELFDKIEPDVGMESQEAQFYFRQLISGVDYLHQRGIAHRDIKPENLLLNRQNVLKISDFGLATVFRMNGRKRVSRTQCGTLPYVAPEVFSTMYDPESADVWSCGVVLVALLSGQLPWDKPSLSCSAFRVWKEQTCLHLRPWSNLDNIALSLLRIILEPKEDARAGIERIKCHRWFKKDFRKKISLDNVLRERSSMKRTRLQLLKESAECCGTLSQPDARASLSPPASENGGEDCGVSEKDSVSVTSAFSQPARCATLLFSQSQSQISQSQNLNLFQRLVRRMTRFCVRVSPADATEAVAQICEDWGWTVKRSPPLQMTVSLVDKRKCPLAFKVGVYEMSDKVLVDFRRSRGDGLEFKRMFLKLRTALADVVCKDSVHWLEQNGLIDCGLNALSLNPV